MFSFIKKLQELLSRIKRNKGLWFTSISVTSISGIIIFMYIILSMTDTVKEEVYVSITGSYFKSLENILKDKKQKYVEVSEAILSNTRVLEAMGQNDMVFLDKYTTTLNEIYAKNELKALSISFFPASDTTSTLRDTIGSTMRSKSQVSGIEVQQDGVFITLIQPVLVGDTFIGLIEIKQSVHSIKDDFEANNNAFVFLLDKKMLVKLSLQAKSGRYKDVVGDYIVYQSAYSSRFYSKISEAGNELFAYERRIGYGTDDIYFRT
ncbi:MAG: hypothetical protein RBT59_09780, partial [Arcobacteraceae bacterium]|nr:hypothetical protein [Arcobacteraceae bacterium]